MSWKSLVCVTLLCGLMAAPVAAQPALVVDLVRSGGLPVLDANGNWQFVVSVTPDASLFADDPDDDPDRGVGGGVATDFGLTVTNSGNAGTSNLSNVVIDLDPDAETHIGSGLTTESDFGYTVLTENFGGSPYTFALGSIEGDDDGVQTDMNQLVAFLGSTYFQDGVGDVTKELFTFSAGKPATEAANGGLEVSVSGDGIYGGGSDSGRLSQNGVNYDVILGALFSATAHPGDTDFNGSTSLADLGTTAGNFGTPGIWHDGDFTGDGNVSLADLGIASGNFGTSGGTLPGAGAGSGGSIPEPSSIVLVLLGCLVASLGRSRS